jgi:hypothetical protein
MRRIVGHKGHIMDQGDGGNEEIDIFNQLPMRAQLRIRLSGLIEDGLLDHDNAQHPPQAFEGGELPVCPKAMSPRFVS